MKITVLGASGKTGIHIVEQALTAGHTVNALVRRRNSLSHRPNLNIFAGDATNEQDIVKVSKGTDVVISALGTGVRKSTLMTDAITAVIAASKVTGVKRFIVVSSYAVGGANQLSFGSKLLARIMLKNIVIDKASSERILKKSDIKWTIVDPTILTDKPKGTGARMVSPNEKITLSHTIPRAEVAAWMLKEAEDNAHVKKEIIISK